MPMTADPWGNPTYREATPADAPAIAAVQVRGWQTAYRDIVPGPYLDRMSVVTRAEAWRRIIGEGNGVLVADCDGTVLGFAAFGPSRDEDARPETGEVGAIYVDPGSWGQTLGQLLLSRAFDALCAEGYREVTLWVLEANEPARAFYESGAMQTDGAMKTAAMAGEEIAEVRYRRRLAPLAEARTSPPGGDVRVFDYDPAWPEWFARERERILAVAPRLEVEHAGSTSVPGLAAKPIVDIHVAAATFDDAIAAVPHLRDLGWEYAGEGGFPGRLYFRKHEGGVRRGQVHLLVRGTRGWRRQLAFRDYLRAHPDVAAEYARLKKGLAASTPDSIAYTRAKTAFVREILARAEAEGATGIR